MDQCRCVGTSHCTDLHCWVPTDRGFLWPHLPLHPHWDPVGQPGSADPLCWNASWHPLAEASPAWATKQIKADVHLGSVCALNTSENSCNRRSLHPRHGCSCGKGCPKAVLYFFIWTIRKKNANKIRNTPIPNNNLYLDCVGKKQRFTFNYRPPFILSNPSPEQWYPFSLLLTLFISPYYCLHETSIFMHDISLSNKMQQEVPQVNYKLILKAFAKKLFKSISLNFIWYSICLAVQRGDAALLPLSARWTCSSAAVQGVISHLSDTERQNTPSFLSTNWVISQVK